MLQCCSFPHNRKINSKNMHMLKSLRSCVQHSGKCWALKPRVKVGMRWTSLPHFVLLLEIGLTEFLCPLIKILSRIFENIVTQVDEGVICFLGGLIVGVFLQNLHRNIILREHAQHSDAIHVNVESTKCRICDLESAKPHGWDAHLMHHRCAGI
jgi:hypothetical protein